MWIIFAMTPEYVMHSQLRSSPQIHYRSFDTIIMYNDQYNDINIKPNTCLFDIIYERVRV